MTTTTNTPNPISLGLMGIGIQVILSYILGLGNFPPTANLLDYALSIAPFSAALIIVVILIYRGEIKNFFSGLLGILTIMAIAVFITILFTGETVFNFDTINDTGASRIFPFSWISKIIEAVRQYCEKASFLNLLMSIGIGFVVGNVSE